MKPTKFEHSGDLNAVLRDLLSCGAKILRSRAYFDSEMAVIEVEVADLAAFDRAFQATNSGPLCF